MHLRCSVHNTPRKWKSWLPPAKFWYNTSFHTSLGCTPFKALYGYDPNVAASPLLPHADDQSFQEMMAERVAHNELLKQHLQMAQNKIKIRLTSIELIMSSRWEIRFY
jgi:hypothetical protein